MYTMMMLISFVALLIGCLVLQAELRLWGDIPAW